jgi:hypothetical protein
MKPSKEDLQRWREMSEEGIDLMPEKVIAILDLVEEQQSLIDEAIWFVEMTECNYEMADASRKWLDKVRGNSCST